MCYSINNIYSFAAGQEMTAHLQIFVFIMNCGLVVSKWIVSLVEFWYSSNNNRKMVNGGVGGWVGVGVFHEIFSQSVTLDTEHFRDVAINPLSQGWIFLFSRSVFVNNIMEKNGSTDFHKNFMKCQTRQKK